MYSLRSILLALFALVAVPAIASEAQPFNIGDETIAPGTRADFRLMVPSRGDEPETFIPVTILHGDEVGPVLAAVSGVHGFEFPPIIAADRLADRIDPADLTGTLILVRIANIPSYEGKSPHLNPIDGKNLNRSFPGSPTGTSTERIADILSREVVAQADFLLDLHCGDGAEFLEPFVGVYGGPLATNFELARKVGEGFGFPNLVRYSMNTTPRGRSSLHHLIRIAGFTHSQSWRITSPLHQPYLNACPFNPQSEERSCSCDITMANPARIECASAFHR